MRAYFNILFAFSILFISCKSDDPCPTEELIEVFTNSDGREIFIYQNGDLYSETRGNCMYELQYFDPNFFEDTYVSNADGTFLIAGENELFPTKSNYIEDFETATSFTDLFLSSLDDVELYWTNLTLQSPATPSTTEYVELSHCILEGNCDFIDNKIELVSDPTNNSNTVLKFICVPPGDLEISKTSIISTLNFYQKSSEVWFEASYFIESGLPLTLVDFENTHFAQSPGPRIIISNNKLKLENKFGAKITYANNTETAVPQNEWFDVKVHLKYSNEDDGVIEVWQDGSLVISETGLNLPTANSIQDKLEVGVTASLIGCELLMDNIRISETPF